MLEPYFHCPAFLWSCCRNYQYYPLNESLTKYISIGLSFISIIIDMIRPWCQLTESYKAPENDYEKIDFLSMKARRYQGVMGGSPPASVKLYNPGALPILQTGQSAHCYPPARQSKY